MLTDLKEPQLQGKGFIVF